MKIKPDEIRKTGRIPAVFYGRKEASTPISVSKTDFLKVWGEAGESSVVTLEIRDPSTSFDKARDKSLGTSKESLIQDVDLDPITGAPRHADFYVFEKGHKLEVALPIEFVGVSPAVKDLGGSLVKVLHELKVEAIPKDLPRDIKVDVASLINFGDQILAKDLTLPTGLELKENPEEVVITVSAPREEKEEEVAPIDLSQIEVEKKGKEEVAEEIQSEDKSAEAPNSK